MNSTNEHALANQTTVGGYTIESFVQRSDMALTYIVQKNEQTFLLHELFLPSCQRGPSGVNPIETTPLQWEMTCANTIDLAQRLSKLQHPGIERTIESFEANNTVYVITQHHQGQSLEDLKPVDDEQLRTIGIQLCDALQAAHTRNYPHMQITPEKIVLTNDGPVLTGFHPLLQDPTLFRHSAPEFKPFPSVPEFTSDVYSLCSSLLDARSNPKKTNANEPEGETWLRSVLSMGVRNQPSERPSLSQLRAALEQRAVPAAATASANKPSNQTDFAPPTDAENLKYAIGTGLLILIALIASTGLHNPTGTQTPIASPPTDLEKSVCDLQNLVRTISSFAPYLAGFATLTTIAVDVRTHGGIRREKFLPIAAATVLLALLPLLANVFFPAC